MPHSFVKPATRVFIAAVFAAVVAGAGSATADAATGCRPYDPPYQSNTYHRVCSNEGEFYADGVRYYAFVDRYDSWLNIAGSNGWQTTYGWFWDYQDTEVWWQARDGRWWRDSCYRYYSDGRPRQEC